MSTFRKTPTIVMEVLSDDASRDRGFKWEGYKAVETLRHYVLVERDRPRLEVYDRRDDGWYSHTLGGVDATLVLSALDLEIPLSEIYADLFA